MKKWIGEIEGIIGDKERIFTDLAHLIPYSTDSSTFKNNPDVVVFPENKEEISEIVKVCNREKIPITPRGSGVGYTGGAVPIEGGVLLSLTKMNKILEIDLDNLIATVEPGVITKTLQDEVKKYGLFYPPDPASLKISTIGGNVAECAGGMSAVKYGVTKHFVLGMEVVIPTGEILRFGGKVFKNVTGYDLTSLMVGSEGTLGIMTEIQLKLLPLPEVRRTMMVLFRDMYKGAKTVSEIIINKIIPVAIEFLDGDSIRCIKDYKNINSWEDMDGMLIIELDGKEEDTKRDMKKLEKIVKKMDGKIFKVAENEEEREEIWETRRALSPAIGKINNTKVNEDIVVPRNKIPDILHKIKEIGKKYNLNIICFGHAGDGNIHTNIMIDGRNLDEVKRSKMAVKEIFSETIKLGGFISGEHGIGLAKKPYLKMNLQKETVELLKRIKRAFDPNNILNPGKIF